MLAKFSYIFRKPKVLILYIIPRRNKRRGKFSVNTSACKTKLCCSKLDKSMKVIEKKITRMCPRKSYVSAVQVAPGP